MLKSDFDQACNILELFIDANIHAVPFRVVDDAPSSYKSMRAFYHDHGYFGINGQASNKTIYSSALKNIQFRAIHDQMHYTHKLTFSFKDEKILSQLTAQKVRSWAWDNGFTAFQCSNVYKLVNAEIKGQIEFYEKNKQFIDDQSAYIMKYLGVKY